MSPPVVYRKGSLEDLTKLRFAEGLSSTARGIEFNVFGIGHELWFAIRNHVIIGLIVLGRVDEDNFKIMFLEVTQPRMNQGIGSGLVQAVLSDYPEAEFSVIPLGGTEEFYKRLGFEKVGMWEMRRSTA